MNRRTVKFHVMEWNGVKRVWKDGWVDGWLWCCWFVIARGSCATVLFKECAIPPFHSWQLPGQLSRWIQLIHVPLYGDGNKTTVLCGPRSANQPTAATASSKTGIGSQQTDFRCGAETKRHRFFLFFLFYFLFSSLLSLFSDLFFFGAIFEILIS